MSDTPRNRLALVVGPLALLTILAVGLGLSLGWAWWPRGEGTPPDKPESPPIPPLSATRFLNTGPDAQYIGTQQCRTCHADEHASYLATAHSRSFRQVDVAEEPPDAVFEHALSHRRFHVVGAGGKLHHKDALQLADGKELPLSDRPLSYLVGSGRFARTYLAEIDGFLMQSPLSWYEGPKAWNMSPGYDVPVQVGFQRYIGFDCLYCHTGRTEMVDGNFYKLKVEELAVSCERCHGPGSLHAKKHEASGRGARRDASGEEDLTIVNPSRLSRELAESICHQCHLESATSVIVRGRQREDFRPGLPWTDFCINYGYASSSHMTVTGHVEQLRQSRCYQADEKLTCITCHDPHAAPTPEEKPAYFRAACQKCHDSSACKAPAPQREECGDDCASCHMPRSSTEVVHVAFSHHRIGIHRPDETNPAPPEPTGFRELVPVLSADNLSEIDRKRTLGLAYLWLYGGNALDARARTYRERALALFFQVEAQGLVDPEIDAARALFAETKDLAAAGAAAQRALDSGKLSPGKQAAVLNVLAKARTLEGKHEAAAEVLARLVKERNSSTDWMRYAVALERSQDVPGAIAAYRQALELDPAQPDVWEKLGPLYERSGDRERAEEAFAKARVLRENLP